MLTQQRLESVLFGNLRVNRAACRANKLTALGGELTSLLLS